MTSRERAGLHLSPCARPCADVCHLPLSLCFRQSQGNGISNASMPVSFADAGSNCLPRAPGCPCCGAGAAPTEATRTGQTPSEGH